MEQLINCRNNAVLVPVVPEENGSTATSFLTSTLAGSGIIDRLLEVRKSFQ